MDILAFVVGVVILVVYRRAVEKNKLLLLLGIALVIAGLIPFILGFVHGFADGFQKGFEQARHPHAVADNMSEEETRNIMISISKCWDIKPSESSLPIVKISVHLNPDASIQFMGVTEAEKSRYGNDPVFKTTADRAMNALKACSPLTFLPKEKYKVWEDMELTFDPKPEP